MKKVLLNPQIKSNLLKENFSILNKLSKISKKKSKFIYFLFYFRNNKFNQENIYKKSF